MPGAPSMQNLYAAIPNPYAIFTRWGLAYNHEKGRLAPAVCHGGRAMRDFAVLVLWLGFGLASLGLIEILAYLRGRGGE